MGRGAGRLSWPAELLPGRGSPPSQVLHLSSSPADILSNNNIAPTAAGSRPAPATRVSPVRCLVQHQQTAYNRGGDPAARWNLLPPPRRSGPLGVRRPRRRARLGTRAIASCSPGCGGPGSSRRAAPGDGLRQRGTTAAWRARPPGRPVLGRRIRSPMWPRRKRSMFGWGSLDVGKDEHFAEVLDDQSVIACSSHRRQRPARAHKVRPPDARRQRRRAPIWAKGDRVLPLARCRRRGCVRCWRPVPGCRASARSGPAEIVSRRLTHDHGEEPVTRPASSR